MRDDFNIQFATQNLLEDIDETSTTSGVGVYHRKKGERTKGGMIYKDLWNEADYKETNLNTILDDIKSHLATSSVLNLDFRLQAIDIVEEIKTSIKEENWEDALDNLEDLQMDLEEENSKEYEEAYSEMFEKAIRRVKSLKSSEDEEDEDDDSMSDYMRYREDPDYYEKNYQEKGTSDYFQRRSLDEEGNDLGKVFATQEKDKVRQLLDKLKQIDYDAYKKLLMAIVDPRPFSYADAEKELTEQMALSENYSRFKNETKTRGKADQFHQAIREVKKRVHEIHKVFEYVNRLKEELNEGEDGLKYKKHTEAAVSKIKEMVSELNMKVKKFK